MKKAIVFVMLFLLIGVSGFVYASNQSTEVQIGEGWNLVYGFYDVRNILQGSEVLPDDIKAIYALLQPSQEYVRLYPNIEMDKLEGIDDDYYEQRAHWVYSDKAGTMKYTSEEPAPLGTHLLYKGWNIIGLIPEMGFGNIDDFSGTCDIEKAFFFNSVKWIELDLGGDDIADDAPYLGIVIKISSDCNLGSNGGGDITPPPEFPTPKICADSDGGVVIDVKGIITNESDGNILYEDFCLDSKGNGSSISEGSFLREYFCGDGTNYYYDAFSCAERGFNLCKDGKCVN